ncbi:MAG: bifunctional ornithine acetyltransferase/N-acetylglutamate synthase [Candidatus Contendobacter odensis]|uniref:Arginine biosynthesis bifunctional protein ArgJ n=1 Tax=Candidatus Contendibacter odensensis TaxID=1400860 RepID=A0A2G6PFW5_9GAMM|nr:MAG: bifunctional ornithine acetyltransferase/N-acetylglutamate synthase [Candidatus Contendobacter odensis]
MDNALTVAGIRLGTAEAGIKYSSRRDLVIIEVAPEAQAAAVFTRNVFCAAPVTVAKKHLNRATPRYLVINTGNANAGTGRQGMIDAEATCQALAEHTGCRPEEVLPFSTGVIGEPLPITNLITGLPAALAALQPDGWEKAAHGIMTTDTRAKWASRQVLLDGHPITITGIAKGAGMICPDMATLLAFVATDARIDDKTTLQQILGDAMAESFNAITVDGDTSTNDACVLLATGASSIEIPATGERRKQLGLAVRDLCIELAQAIIRDGEGATKFITVQIEGGQNVAECQQVAYTIAHSPLVKTAFFASDPNWGRILAALGRAGVSNLDLERVAIYLDTVCIVRNGGRATDYTEAAGAHVMQRPEITLRIDLARGEATARIWTTDLSYDYVRINAEYRT